MSFTTILGVTINRKKVQCLLRKFDIFCPIRSANPYQRLAKATKAYNTVPNILKRKFNQCIAKKALLTGITYLAGDKGFSGYLSPIKDGAKTEISASYVSDNLKLDISLKTIDRLVSAYIDSDQGVHYTSPKCYQKLADNALGSSMSKRGNCWDNAPQESFFCHFKDETNYKECLHLKESIDDYLDYYNNERGQWNLKNCPLWHTGSNFYRKLHSVFFSCP